VKLDGNESSDADGDDLSYRWTLRGRPAASTARLTGADTANPSFVADRAGTYEAVLVVNDGEVDSEPDSVGIEASDSGKNSPPVANAGEDQNVATGATVTLDGSGSTDANGDPLTYSWTLTVPQDNTAVLTGADTATPSFVADRAVRYEAELVVSDGTDASEPDSVSITAVVTTSTIPQFPNTFFGDVTVKGGHPAQVGMTITAVVNRGVVGSEKRYSLTITEPGKYGAPNGLKLKVGGDQQGDIDNQSTIAFFLSVDTLPEDLNEFESLAEVPFFDDRNPHIRRVDLVANFNGEIPDRSES
jgi:hypothetical protein